MVTKTLTWLDQIMELSLDLISTSFNEDNIKVMVSNFTVKKKKAGASMKDFIERFINVSQMC